MFPKYKIKKILGIEIKRRDNWEDLGKESSITSIEHGDEVGSYRVHSFCGDRLSIGRDGDGTLFKFCSRCMVKVGEEEKEDEDTEADEYEAKQGEEAKQRALEEANRSLIIK